MKKKILFIALHPIFISLLVSILIIFLFVAKATKYTIHQDDEHYHAHCPVFFYDDLDANGYSDEIRVEDYAGANGVAALFVHLNPHLYYNEWDFNGSFSFTTRDFIQTGDFDNNGKKEVYVFTISSDSVFLNIVSDFYSRSPFLSRRFITTFRPFNGKPNICIVNGGFHDMNNDGYKDFVFAVCSGFSVEPRNVYIYDIHNDNLIVSPVNGYFISNLQVKDLNGDGFKEIIVNGYASQNVIDTTKFKIHDLCCWLIVLDHNLHYLFPPVKFPYYGYSSLSTIWLPGRKKSFDLFSCYYPPDSSGKCLQLFHFNTKGKLLKMDSVKGLNLNQAGNFFASSGIKNAQLGLSTLKGAVYFFDTAFNVIKRLNSKADFIGPFDTLDIDNDGQKEMTSIDQDKSLLTISRSDFSHPASIRLPAQDWGFRVLSLKVEPNHPPELVLYSHNKEYLYSYSINPYYYAQWGIYIGIFITVYLFVLLIRRIQKIQFERQTRTEKKITELQLKIVRNQMDPHFTMNAVNSVIASINQNDKEQASQHLLHFSDMYRHLVLTADKIKCSLSEEIEFTRNYLIMEQFRYKDKFTFDIIVNPDVDLSWEVPKMVIQSPVENAVKHGLLNLPGQGHLQINALVNDNDLVLEVIDDGIGRIKASEIENKSTGKGMKVMGEFLDLFQKTTGTKVETEIHDLLGLDGNPSGTKVIVRIKIS